MRRSTSAIHPVTVPTFLVFLCLSGTLAEFGPQHDRESLPIRTIHLAARDLPPDYYGDPRKTYGYPPPYEFDPSTSDSSTAYSSAYTPPEESSDSTLATTTVSNPGQGSGTTTSNAPNRTSSTPDMAATESSLAVTKSTGPASDSLTTKLALDLGQFRSTRAPRHAFDNVDKFRKLFHCISGDRYFNEIDAHRNRSHNKVGRHGTDRYTLHSDAKEGDQYIRGGLAVLIHPDIKAYIHSQQPWKPSALRIDLAKLASTGNPVYHVMGKFYQPGGDWRLHNEIYCRTLDRPHPREPVHDVHLETFQEFNLNLNRNLEFLEFFIWIPLTNHYLYPYELVTYA
ncbi:hypothetical protein RJ55_06118 [Drechmeria coniospora]|nr:hypothetical protein RJ55_06118 [Drechmeria coniospora]